MTARERANSWWTGELPLIPVMGLFGIRPRDIDAGTSHAYQQLSPDLLAADGTLPAGLLAVLADVVTGGAIAHRLPIGQGIVTVTLTVEPTVEQLPTEGTLVGSATVVAERGPLYLAEGDVRTLGGQQVARLSAWFMRLPGRSAVTPSDPPSTGPVSLPADAGLGPIGRLVGITELSRADGSAAATAVVRPDLVNLGLALHGGAGALLADLVCLAALGEGASHQPLTSTYSYLRSTGVIGAPVQVQARVLKPGRTVAAVEAEVLTAAGKPALHVVTNAAMRID